MLGIFSQIFGFLSIFYIFENFIFMRIEDIAIKNLKFWVMNFQGVLSFETFLLLSSLTLAFEQQDYSNQSAPPTAF